MPFEFRPDVWIISPTWQIVLIINTITWKSIPLPRVISTVRLWSCSSVLTHICLSNQTIIDSGNGFSLGRRQAIIKTNAGIWLIGPLRLKFSDILVQIHIFSFKKMHLKRSSAKWQPFCLGLNAFIFSQDHATSQYVTRQLWLLICGILKMIDHHIYIDVIMTTMASQITSLTVVYSTVYSDADQRKHQSSASLAFVWGIHRDRWIPRTKGQLRGKCFHLMTSSCAYSSSIKVGIASYQYDSNNQIAGARELHFHWMTRYS